jgi:GT2 family glycosyltransferase
MHIAVVVLNYNGRDLLKTYLPSIVKYSGEADVWVIDNDSSDDSIEVLKTDFPQVKCVVNSKNTGYAGGYNEGLQTICADVYVLINSDVRVTEGWLHPITRAFAADPKLGAAQPVILDDKKNSHYEYAGAAGGFIDRFGYPFCRGRVFDEVEEINSEYNHDIDCFWASGACLAVRAEVFHKLGGFYEAYFAHMEEIDLCWRMQSHGYAIRCLTKSKVYHLGGGTLTYQNPRKVYLNFRNNLIMMGRQLPHRDRIRVVFFRMVLDGISAIRFLLTGKWGFFSAILKAHADYYRHLGDIKRYRKSRTAAEWRALNGRYPRAIVWDYFVQGKKRFTQITGADSAGANTP